MKTSKSFDFIALSATSQVSQSELTDSELYAELTNANADEVYRGGTYYYAENALLKIAKAELKGYIFKVVRGSIKRTERKERIGNKLVTVIEEEETPGSIMLVAKCQVKDSVLAWD